MRLPISIGAILLCVFALNPAQSKAKSCFWKFGSDKAACECNKLGYAQGTPMFLECMSIQLQDQQARSKAIQGMSDWYNGQLRQQYPQYYGIAPMPAPNPSTTCFSNRQYDGTVVTTCR